ncbi:hypothetical protein BDR04DRAFT_1117365 [Suillus decipiens]|nr:hypothetical protein BDR04DRAFT_1117365 [Suillus decipiens]
MSGRDMEEGPAKPSETQPSAWYTHPSIQIIIWDNYASTRMSINPVLPFFPNGNPSSITYTILVLNIQGWIPIFVSRAVVQASLTPGLHHSELVANVIPDERQEHTLLEGNKGLRVATNLLESIFTYQICLVLLLAKPFLRVPAQRSLHLPLSRAIPTTRPQLTTYGYIQTPANLMGGSPVMWWGQKQDQVPYYYTGRVSCRDERSSAARCEDGLLFMLVSASSSPSREKPPSLETYLLINLCR